ncbi:CheY-like chemotaxis protein [Caulobacter ginsengisoli]|uniref:CheY-like chemotaxis protein n=1 Tax=Caulobacter ginsengisoli TaxID=400775 RepID=A0ABU0IXM1_9CAUL|nr:response regulator [Caulobacter ginsengisoli]MDQ0466761.1 CheY-like chemotaxis protein [Caulobacter ginsengisoli]
MIPALNGLRLLVVEDETMLAMMIESMLDDLGCVVVDVAGTVARGVALASDESLEIDGAILDVNLGGEKVYPVAEALISRRVPFIFSTGYGIDGIAAQFSHVPALAKPYRQEALEGMLVSTLGSGRA